MSFFLFPGQGSQAPGMGKDFYEGAPVSRETLDQAERVLGPGYLDTLFEGSAEDLRETRMAQTALVAVGVAVARHLDTMGIRPKACAGHSIGELSALVVAGSLDFEASLRLTVERARLMSEEVPEGSMAAVIGLAPEAIGPALPDEVDVANFNGPGQTIVSGSIAGLEQASISLKEAGARRVLPLQVSGPFHSRFMRGAGEEFKEFLRDVEIAPPAVRFVSSVTGVEEADPETIRDLLSKQLYSPVRWTGVMLTLGEGTALEVGPGKTLQGIAKRIEGAASVSLAGTLEATQTLHAA